MKKFCLLLILLSNAALAQRLPNAFKIGTTAEVLPGDTVRTWHNSKGKLCSKNCAFFYRTGKADSINISLVGKFYDSYTNGQLFFTGNFTNALLNGEGVYYYPNGVVREKGSYVGNKRTGRWEYFFDNGKLQKVLNFKKDAVLIDEQYEATGKQTITNGEGEYKGDYQEGNYSALFNISGKVKFGEPDGQWTIRNAFGNKLMAYEFYENGTFIGGKDFLDVIYKKSLMGFSGYCVNEDILLDKNTEFCEGLKKQTITFSDYLHKDLYPGLIAAMKNYPALKNQWLIVGVTFNKTGPETTDVYSSVDDSAMEQFIHNYLLDYKGWAIEKKKKWEDVQTVFFTININNALSDEKVYILDDLLRRNHIIR